MKNLHCVTLVRLVVVGLSVVAAGGLRAQQAPLPLQPNLYHLHSSDEVAVKYRLSPEYDSTATIQPDGFATLPVIGSIHLEGLTIQEATKAIRTEADKRLNDPEVAVELKAFEKPYVTVTGEVTTPGKVEYHGPMTALRAITLAGGFHSDTAQDSNVILVRPISATEGETHVLNLKRIMQGKDKEDMLLKPGDMLIVRQNRLTRVTRIVKIINPGVYIPLGGSF